MGDNIMKPRPINTRDGHAIIPLTKGYVAIIDEADLHLVVGKNWHAYVDKKPDGSIRSVYAVRNSSEYASKKLSYLHCVIMGGQFGLWVDHKDGDGLNNTRANLRRATPSQNQFNGRLRISNTSGVKGVSWSARHNKWLAAIRHDGKQKYLGLFVDLQCAANAYANASTKFHGEFGRLA